MKKLMAGMLLTFFVSLAFAQTNGPHFVFLPNVKTNYLMSVNAEDVLTTEQKVIELVKKTLNITDQSPYTMVRIRIVYNETDDNIDYLVVYLLSSLNKSVELVRLNLNNLTVVSVIKNYDLQLADLKQSPYYAEPVVTKCPDKNVQFVIGNNFKGDSSVEKEVQKVYQLAKSKGYKPMLMNINDRKGPQPTVQAYLNWMSCPQVKGFYNESHGWSKGIVLSDEDFTYDLVEKNLVAKLKSNVILFDSCLTFHDPLLAAMSGSSKGNAKQYFAGFISLPFGPSERTASCIWTDAMNAAALNQKMIEVCAGKYGLELDGFKIKGNGDNHLERAS